MRFVVKTLLITAVVIFACAATGVISPWWALGAVGLLFYGLILASCYLSGSISQSEEREQEAQEARKRLHIV